jgi:hypothetical protein
LGVSLLLGATASASTVGWGPVPVDFEPTAVKRSSRLTDLRFMVVR